jgi:RecA/RadA recombinase
MPPPLFFMREGFDPLSTRKSVSDHQVMAVDHAFKMCQDENIKLLIIDSVLSHFRSEYVGRETLAERQQKLNSHLHKDTDMTDSIRLVEHHFGDLDGMLNVRGSCP